MTAGTVTVLNGGGSHTFTSDTGAWTECIPGQGCAVTLGPGTYSYNCRFHSSLGMTGVINVT
jgi:plastocyanin